MKKKIIFIIAAVILPLLYIFFTSVCLNPLIREGAWFYFILFIYIGAVIALLKAKNLLSGLGFFTSNTVKPYNQSSAVWKGLPKVCKIVFISVFSIFILVQILSTPFFNYKAYRDQLTQPETRAFTSDVQPLDIDQLPIVDKDLAYKLADKKMGEKPSLGSIATLGEPTIQRVDGRLIWVVPLLHSNVFNWLANSEGTPGYIMVSATNPRDVEYVDKHLIKYQPNAYLMDNLKRHVRLTAAPFIGITDYSFELDDSGNPYWVVTTYENKWILSLPEATGAIIVNATTGKCERYTINNMPAWADRVQPESFIIDQIANRGEYVHGLFNFSNKDKFQSSDNHAIVYNNGNCYLFTGLTSVGADESAIGFMMINMVTKKPYLYQMSGATEFAAQQSAEGKVQNLRYFASFPLITNVDGIPTYFMTLKDDAGLIKMYAFVSVSDYTSVGTGDTIANAKLNYENVLRTSSGGTDIGTDKSASIEGTVSRIAVEQTTEGTFYKIILAEKPDTIYVLPYSASAELALTREGDKVNITYPEGKKGIITANGFDNMAFTQEK